MVRRWGSLNTREIRQLPAVSWALCALIILTAVAAPEASLGASTPVGKLAQLRGPSGCLVDRSKPAGGCARVRALRGPAPFLGSNALVLSSGGRHLYVASSTSDAIAVFERNLRTGRLTQRRGAAGCIAARGGNGCARAVALDGPNSVAFSADGANVYATSRNSDSVSVFDRNPASGALTQVAGDGGCVANSPTSGCATGRALDGADVVVVSPDLKNVYVGSFFGNAVAVFARNASTGALTQPADTTGCLVNTPTDGCTTALGLAAPEGMAISGDGNTLYVASAVSNALVVLTRDPSTGALTQATDGSGCIVNTALAGCTTGTQLSGANAVAVSPDDDDVYVTSLLSNSLTSFTRAPTTGKVAQQTGTSACVVFVLAVGCSLGHALSAPEGLTVSADGASVYAAAFTSGAIDVFNRNTGSGAVIQKGRRAGCVAKSVTPNCTLGRGLVGVSSLVVSPDGRYLYSGAFGSNAVGVFRRVER